MTNCSECGTKMINKSDVVTEFENKFNIIYYKTVTLYQCPKCKNVEVG